MRLLSLLNIQQNRNQKNSIRLILLFSVVFNLLSFLLVIAIYPPSWYTNDDYRMMTIASGAYTGTPSADIVFMRYPIGFMLSGLYSITAQIPWYGLFTMICMFVPSCIFCYYIVKKAYLKNYTILGVCLYVLAFLFLIRKYICMPQFTLTSAFMGAGAITLLYEMPAQKNKVHIIFASICAVLSFSIRSKAFYLLLPVIALIIVVRIFSEKGTKIWKSFASVCLATLVLCGCVFAVDYLVWNQSEEYQDFKSFNIARSSVYDYGSIPPYYDNMPFYVENGISEVAFRTLASRYLDLDDSVDTETLESIGDYIQQLRTESGSIFERIKSAFEETIEYWLDSNDEVMKYSVMFVFILLAVVLILSVKNKKLNIIFPATVAGIVLESVYLAFCGRLIIRIVDMLLLSAGVLGCLITVDMLRVRKKSIREYCSELWLKKKRLVSVVLILLSVVTVVYSGIICLNTALKDKYQSVTVTYNYRIDTLRNYARLHPESFFFYDSNDFIASTGYVFQTYSEAEVLNYDSLGSWNCTSPTYYQRNARFGFTSSADGLTSDDCDVYFATLSPLRVGMTKTLKDRYNKKLTLVDSVESEEYILHIYMVVDDD